MKRISMIIALVSALLFSIYSQTPQSSGQTPQSQAPTAKPKQAEGEANSKQPAERKDVPEGTIVKGNTVTVKAGYELVKQPGSNTVVMAKKKGGGGGITGRFNCSCRKSAETQGNCYLATHNGDMAKCWPEPNGCSDCQLEILIYADNPTTKKK